MIAYASTTNTNQAGLNTLDLILNAGIVAKFVLLILLFCSIVSWAIIFMKSKQIKKSSLESKKFLDMFWRATDLEEVFIKVDQYEGAFLAHLFQEAYRELKKLGQTKKIALENLTRTLNRATLNEIENLESSINILASIGSTAPFIGLFGTVWGIMDSFQNIGSTGSANLAIVAPGISEALIATAAGLVVAIPAVLAYNYFVGKIKTINSEMESFSQDFLNLIQRNTLINHDLEKEM
jgi:biopolymer transport protein TolQ